MYSKVLIPAFLIILLFSAGISAQSPSRILKNAERAMGGASNLKKVNSVRRTGKVIRISDGAEGTFQMSFVKPDLYHISFDIAGFENEVGHNGRSGWSRDSRDGLSTFTGKRSVDLQAEADYRNSLWLDAKKSRSRITSGGTAIIDGKRTNVINLTTSSGVMIKTYFDAATNLPIREEFPADDEMVIYDYSDHRPVSGIQQPHSIKITIGEQQFDLTVDETITNRQIAASVFDFPQISGDPLPDIAQLLKDVQNNADLLDDVLENYSYMQTITKREIGKDGILRPSDSETFMLSFYKGNRFRRLVERNQKPLSEREQERVDRDVAKEIENIEKRIAREEARAAQGRPVPSENDNRISIAEVMRASRLINPRRERFRGREVIVFDFEPDPNFDMRNAKSMLKFFGKTAGVMWIDEKDKQIARIDAYLADSFKVGGGLLAKLRKGATFTLENERVNEEIWLPSQADINLSVRVLLLKGVNVNQVVRSFDYKKYTTEVESAEVDEIDEEPL